MGNPIHRLEHEELEQAIIEYLAAYKVPRKITFRESLPANMVGKVLRRKILEEEGHIEPPKPPEN